MRQGGRIGRWFMQARPRQFLKSQRGSAMVMVAISMVLVFGFAVIAIDVGTSALVKTQLQNAADAAVLAGIYSWVQSDDSTQGIAAAIDFADRNDALVAQSGGWNMPGPVVITDADIDFPPPDFAGQKKMRVTTHRWTSRGDDFKTYFVRILNPSGDRAEMTAHATASFFWVCGASCLKPWAPPDRWADADSNGIFNADGGDYYDPVTTGYTDADLGTEISLVLMNGNDAGFGQFFYYSINFPPVNDGDPISGADQYEEWMCAGDCLDNTFNVDIGDVLRVEPGKMVGPNGDGLECIINTDPTAEWDAVNGRVVNSAFTTSPRIVKAALFDPSAGLDPSYGGGNVVHVVKIMVLFIEEDSGKDQIVGRFMRLNEPDGTICEDQTVPTYLYKTALIE